jgi:acyl-CoA thioester hydrolase
VSENRQSVFSHAVRVPYAHVDSMGVVYYANYYLYFEMARSEMLREIGRPYPEMERAGVMLPVLESHCRYRRPAHYDELLEIRSRCSRRKNIRLRIDYRVLRGNETIADGYTEHVCLSSGGRVLRIAPELERLFGAVPPSGPPEGDPAQSNVRGS